LECFKQLENNFEVVYLKPENGVITKEIFLKALTPDTIFVSIMQVNNETGAISPLKDIAKAIKESGINAVLHTDAVQGFLKEPFNYHTVDMASFSGHKTHGPKGVGGFYLKKGIKIKPVTFGGGQEKGIFSGTSNTPAIMGWGAAAQELDKNFDSIREQVMALKNTASEKLTALGGIILSPEKATPFILNIAFPGYIAENILHYLSKHDIYVSTGSACSSKKGSHVLKAIGQEKLQKSSLRLSFSHYNTMDEILILSEVMEKALKDIIKN
jgi:cysteine desulfurase